MDIHSRPIQERIQWLLEHARNHSVIFSGPESSLARQRYLAEHPTAIAVFKCMDGRINIPVATNTPFGIIQPFRNLGGKFDLGWPYLGEVLARCVQDCVSAGRRVLFLVTYHYSKGDPLRGCAGFDFDTEAAKAHADAIKRQVEYTFGRGHGTVYPVVCGFETDADALVLHGNNGDLLDVGQLRAGDTTQLGARLDALFPDMPDQIRDDFIPLIRGNREHIAEVEHDKRILDSVHREWMICVGRGFDFLHMPNLALIIGPYSPDLDEPVRRAANIIEDNMRVGRIPDDGFLLLASSPYSEIGMDRARAELKSRFLADFAARVVSNEFPALADKMHRLTAVVNWRSRNLEMLTAA
ncbi:MAG: hypothetical protein WCZ87_05225 [Thiohalobacteraceae bacterium]